MFWRQPFSHRHAIIVNSIPKAGTNLLKNVALAIPGTRIVSDFSLATESSVPSEQLNFVLGKIKTLNPGDVYTGHVPYSPIFSDWLKGKNIKQLFIYRDPRDYAVSLHHYIMKNVEPRHAYYGLLDNLEDDSARLMAAIKGAGIPIEGKNSSPQHIPGVLRVFEMNYGWLADKNTLAVSYEDLVDPQNGPEAVRKIFRFLGFNLRAETEIIQSVYEKGLDPKKSHTFRKGISGGWKEEFTPDHINAFKENAENIMEKYGYSW